MRSILAIAIDSLWYILPAYIANMSPVIFGGGKPLDFNKKFVDGKRILGNHKTIKGFVAGVICGTAMGIAQGRVLQGILLSLGAMIGDIVGSFIKRRLNIEEGGPVPLLDQEGFLIFSILLTYPIENIGIYSVIFLLFLTPLLHKGTNVVAYYLKLKEVGH